MNWFDWILVVFLLVNFGWRVGELMDKTTVWNLITVIIYGLLGFGIIIFRG